LHRKRNVSSNLRERKILVEILEKMGGFELKEWLFKFEKEKNIRRNIIEDTQGSASKRIL